MFFVSMQSEVRTEELIRAALAAGQRVVVPITRLKERRLDPSELRDFDADLAEGTFGVWEPKPECYRPVAPHTIDLVIMPGLAFDAQGGRTGYGMGLYDRFLKRVPCIVPRIALAYEVQVVDEVPMKPYDQRVDLILTEDRRIECARR
jgi:5-formyltetrahydrofolate cyclo-ligase